MPLKLDVGASFPDFELPDEHGENRSISELAGKQPLILAFFRGPW